MSCKGCRPKGLKKAKCVKKRKRLPSINPFFHFLKCVWRKFRGCKRSVVVRYAVKKWRRMSPTEKRPFFDAAFRAQDMHRQTKKKDCCAPLSSSKSCAKPCAKPKCSKKKKKASCPKY